jgi:hypothetical protein
MSAGESTPVGDCEYESAANETGNEVFHHPILKIPSQIDENIGSTFRQPADSAANNPLRAAYSKQGLRVVRPSWNLTLFKRCVAGKFLIAINLQSDVVKSITAGDKISQQLHLRK